MTIQPLPHLPPRRRPLTPMAHKPHLYPLAASTAHASLRRCAGGESTWHMVPIPSLTKPLCSGSLAAHLPRTLSTPPAMAPALEAPHCGPVTVFNVYISPHFPSHEPSDLVAKVLQWQVSYLIPTYPASFGDSCSPIVIVEWTLRVAVYSLMYVYTHWQVLYHSGVPLRPFLHLS